MKAPLCKICGTAHFSTQPCPARGEKDDRSPELLSKTEAVVKMKETVAGVRVTEPGAPVMVRIPRALLKRLDEFRGGKTRPEAVRLILEGGLPK